MDLQQFTWAIPLVSGLITGLIEVVRGYRKLQTTEIAQESLAQYYPKIFNKSNILSLPWEVVQIVYDKFNRQQAWFTIQKRVVQSLFIGSMMIGLREGITQLQSLGMLLALVGWYFYDSDFRGLIVRPWISLLIFVALTGLVTFLIS